MTSFGPQKVTYYLFVFLGRDLSRCFFGGTTGEELRKKKKK